MSSVSNALFAATYLMGAIAAGVAAHELVGVSLTICVISGSLFLLFCGQFQAQINRAFERRVVEEELATLRRSSLIALKELEQTRRKVRELKASLDDRVKSRNKEIVAEVKVLEGLIKQLHDHTSEPAEISLAASATAYVSEARDDAIGQDVIAADETVLLDVIHDALEDNRVDLYVQPIVSLPQRKVRFYEAFSRLRDTDGALIMPAQYLRVAEPAGLMSIIDNLLLFRCVQVVRRLSRRNQEVAVFCNISAHSLRDADFFPQFVEYMESNTDLARSIIFEFGQNEIEQNRSWDEEQLARLAELGFAFSMDKVQNLDFDLHVLRQRNFRYLKVDADILNNGMLAAGARIHASDFKELAERNGVDLIAEKIEDERTVIDVLEYNVDFGQGYLFGRPEPIRGSSLDGAGATIPKVMSEPSERSASNAG
jgi:cyclic-di-GMP phosphodiesterase TipF (flagellum assembly factor)